ncbi:MAG: hypothetical protein JWO67_2230 [Streptosporangiaceae bacterium]|nr:hypothetical protein [Streptosporangiaceae bacterium]
MTNWAEVSRADAAERGDCWYQVDANDRVIDWWCEAHERYEPPSDDAGADGYVTWMETETIKKTGRRR